MTRTKKAAQNKAILKNLTKKQRTIKAKLAMGNGAFNNFMGWKGAWDDLGMEGALKTVLKRVGGKMEEMRVESLKSIGLGKGVAGAPTAPRAVGPRDAPIPATGLSRKTRATARADGIGAVEVSGSGVGVAVPHNKASRGGMTRNQWIRAMAEVNNPADEGIGVVKADGEIREGGDDVVSYIRTVLPVKRWMKGKESEQARQTIDALMEGMMRGGADIGAVNEEGSGEEDDQMWDQSGSATMSESNALGVIGIDVPNNKAARGGLSRRERTGLQANVQGRSAVVVNKSAGKEAGRFSEELVADEELWGEEGGEGELELEKYGGDDEEMWDEELGEEGQVWSEDEHEHEDESDYEYEYLMIKRGGK